MQRFLPNTVLQNRFLLREELSVDQQTGQQVWAVLDQQTGQSLIARLYADGRAEWFNDNRPTASAVIPPVATLPSVDPKKPLASPPSIPVSNGRSRRSVLVFALLLCMITGGYVYRNQLLDSIQTLRTFISPAIATTDSINAIARSVDPSGLAGSTSMATSLPRVAPVSAAQVAHLLSLLRQIPGKKHAAIFSDARLAFTTLRQTPGNEQYVDSLYTTYMGRAAQSYLAHQQNGDLASKKYALDWYRMAYVLKPSSDLLDRLERLSNEPRKSLAKPGSPVRKTRPRESLFITDPEVTH